MDFYKAQDDARRATGRLMFFFVLAVISLITITNVLVMAVFGYFHFGDEITGGAVLEQFDWQRFLLIGAAVIAIILIGSLYKTKLLSGGGRVVAESLGGRLIPPNTSEFQLKRALNVVEEMALAAGTPVPPVYLLADESGINAFAAGFTPSDAVIGLTQGTLNQLSREQLQGVIAHEFSHILNGDMRLNIRLIGILHGILLIGMIGYFVLRSGSHSGHRRSSNDGKGAGAVLVLGLGLMLIGFAGTFFGNLIKASVSRQREYLADSSAIQFTRNPQGIAGALKKIGAVDTGSILQSPAAPEFSHSYFALGVSGFLSSVFATHPPLTERIKRIDPRWDGRYPLATDSPPLADEPADGEEDKRAQTLAKMMAASAVLDEAMNNVNRVGQLGDQQLQYARALLEKIPVEILESVRDPYDVRAAVYALIIDAKAQTREDQLAHLQQHGDLGIYELTKKLLPQIDALNATCRLPVVDLSLPALRAMSIEQYRLFKNNLAALMNMDSKIDLFEWVLHKILTRHLDAVFVKPKPKRAKYSTLIEVQEHCEILFSALAHAGHSDSQSTMAAIAAARQEAGLQFIEIQSREAMTLSRLNTAIDQLALLKPLSKPKLLKACLACVTADGRVVPKEMELMRAISDSLDCPMPPFLYGGFGSDSASA